MRALALLAIAGCGSGAPRPAAVGNRAAAPAPEPVLPEPWFADKPEAYPQCGQPADAPAVALPAPFERCDGREEAWASPPGGNELHFHYLAFSPATTRARREREPGVCCYLVWEFPRRD